MSNLERGAISLDNARLKRLMIEPVDFDAYMDNRESEAANVKAASDFTEDLMLHFAGDAQIVGDCLPWSKAQDLIRFRHSELTIWNGINGHGKSNMLGQVILSLISSRKACIASLEMKPVTSLVRMVRQGLGGSSPSRSFVDDFMKTVDGKLWFYDQTGTISMDRVISVIYYSAEKLGVNHFVVDSLMKCGIGEDDYNNQKKFVDKLCAAAKDTKCHIHLVTHARKGDDEHNIPGKMSVKGSGSITDQADNVLTVWRNKKKEQTIADKKDTEETKRLPDAMLICDKQRNGEWEGRINLWFNQPSMRYLERYNEHVLPMI